MIREIVRFWEKYNAALAEKKSGSRAFYKRKLDEKFALVSRIVGKQGSPVAQHDAMATFIETSDDLYLRDVLKIALLELEARERLLRGYMDRWVGLSEDVGGDDLKMIELLRKADRPLTVAAAARMEQLLDALRELRRDVDENRKGDEIDRLRMRVKELERATEYSV